MHSDDTSMPPPQHIGIVGCSAEGAALCYRTICLEGETVLGAHAHPEVSLHTCSLAKYVESLERNDLQGVADLMLHSARRLAAAGADFLICPDNTIHAAFELVELHTPLPWLHIADTVANEAAARKFERVGVMGTSWLVSSDVYPRSLAAVGIDCVRPPSDDRDMMGKLIMDELVRGIVRDETVDFFRQAIDRLQKQGCDAVVLGCTEIPLIINDRNSALPTLDSTRLLARAALLRAVALGARPSAGLGSPAEH